MMTSDFRDRVIVFLESITILVCLWMFATRGHADDSHVRVAVLEQRSDAQDRHLQNTDDTVGRLAAKVDSLSADMSEMHGEERIAWGVITLLCGGTLAAQVRKKS